MVWFLLVGRAADHTGMLDRDSSQPGVWMHGAAAGHHRWRGTEWGMRLDRRLFDCPMDLLRNKPLLGAAGVAVIAVAAWLAFGFFGIQAAFIDDEVNEAGPVFTATEAEQDAIAATDEFQDAMTEANENMSEADESVEDMATDSGDEILTVATGDFGGQSRYTITGQALVLNDGGPQRFLRFEDFESDNGPDLKVYLRADSGDFVSLGDLKGNIGDQNYEIPPEVDLAVFDTVEIWCERFGVGFGSAPLTLT